MDPGQKFLQKLETVPNLVDEDPSIITPKKTSYVDVPWSDFSDMLAQKRKLEAEKKKSLSSSSSSKEASGGDVKKLQDDADLTFTQPEKGSVEDFSLGNWDAATGYQDAEHRKATATATTVTK